MTQSLRPYRICANTRAVSKPMPLLVAVMESWDYVELLYRNKIATT
jgi:hypothetical protein